MRITAHLTKWLHDQKMKQERRLLNSLSYYDQNHTVSRFTNTRPLVKEYEIDKKKAEKAVGQVGPVLK